jgi:hypothetical protein
MNKAGILLFFIFVSSCTFTTTKTNNPGFINIILLEKKLDSLISCENFNINGREITTNKKSTSEIEISTINCRDVSRNSDQMVDLAKTIASEIKKNLTDPNQYDTYKVLFITKKTNGVLTKTNSKSYVFNSKDL